MDRRELFKNLAILGLGSVIPFGKMLANISYAKRPFHQFKLGNLDMTVVTDGHIIMSPVQPVFPNGDEQAEKELLRKSFRSTEEVDLGMNMLIIKKDKEVILIDTGTGGAFGPASGWLLSSLKDADIDPAGITRIVISHAHPDHIGGLLTKDDKPVFANAQVYLSKAEHAFWMAAEQDFSRSKFSDKKLLAVFTAATQKTIRTLDKRLHLFNDGDELFGCLRMQLAPGHTPGHTLVHVFSGAEEMVHIADLMHSDVLLFPHPEWGFNGDTDFDMAAATRKRVLAELAGGQKKVFAYHLPWPGIGHVRSKEGAYEWVAETYAFPV
ncbi:MAG: MBL fold metallo-hydrolase [Chitinophagaceae bacterium]